MAGAFYIQRIIPIPCRSEPARDSGVSATYLPTDRPLSRAGSLLQEDCVDHGIQEIPRIIVGAGLLAKALCQTTSPVADPPPSRASPLPQGDWCSIQAMCSGTKKPPPATRLTGASSITPSYISTCVPNSITRFNGRLKNRKFPLAFFNMNANSASRQRAMPSSFEAITVSRLRK